MANKHMRRYSMAYVIRKMQIKTIKYHYTPIRRAKPGTLTAPKACAELFLLRQELSSTAGENHNGTGTLEDSLAVSHKRIHTLTIPSCNHVP